MKRDRDESDDEDAQGGYEADDENKDVRVRSKKRKVSGYYGTSSLVTVSHLSRMVVLTRDAGANDENAPRASASQAEDNHKEIYEDDESSADRPLSPIFERPSSEERENEEIEELLSFVQDSPAASPEPVGHTSFSVYRNGFDDGDVEMSDESDEEQNDDENTPPAPAPPAAILAAPAQAVAPPVPAPAIAPLPPSPAIVPSVAARPRPRGLRRDVVTIMGNTDIVYGQVFENGNEV